MAVAFFAFAACTTHHPYIPPTVVLGEHRRVAVVDTGLHAIPDLSVGALCTRLAWTTCDIPEYTDDQSFMAADDSTYGPYAYIAPSDSLAVFTSDTCENA